MSRSLPVLLLLATALAAADPKASVEKERVVVTGLPSANGLSVVVAEGTEADIATRPPVSGEWSADGGRVVFTPKYPLKPGSRYRILGTSPTLEVRTEAARPGKPTVVTAVYPSGPKVPENVLRFYVLFNRPMPRGDVYDYVRVIDDAGKPVVQPFLLLDDELWNPDQTRLTLLIDPGRIKQEVKPRVDIGPVFRAGKRYVLVIKGNWPDLDGRTLGADVARPLTVTDPIADAVDPKAWKLTAPPDAKAALSVTFDRPMDHALLQRSLAVIGPDGNEVVGTAEIPAGERAWGFRPRTAWGPGEYKLRVDPVLEDVCGNAVGRPFEVDLLRPAKPAPPPTTMDLPFRVVPR
jgi:hypothetical protein